MLDPIIKTPVTFLCHVWQLHCVDDATEVRSEVSNGNPRKPKGNPLPKKAKSPGRTPRLRMPLARSAAIALGLEMRQPSTSGTGPGAVQLFH